MLTTSARTLARTSTSTSARTSTSTLARTSTSTLLAILFALGVIAGLIFLTRSDKRNYLTAQKSFSTASGGDLKTKALLRYYSNFSVDFYFKTQEPDVVLMSMNTDPVVVVKLTEGVLVIGVVPLTPPEGSQVPLPITFAPNKFTRSTFVLNDNDWHHVKVFFNESISRLLCKVDNEPLVALPLAKPSWNKVRISFGKIDSANYKSNYFKGCFHNLGYKDELDHVSLTDKDMISTYSFKVC